MSSQVPDIRHGAAGPFALLSSALALVGFFLAIPLLLLFGMGLFTLCNTHWKCVVCFLFCKSLELRDSLESQKRLQLWNVGTVKVMGTYEGGLHFCVMR